MASRGSTNTSILLFYSIVLAVVIHSCQGNMEIIYTLQHPNVICPEESFETISCKYGAYEYNPDSRYCKNRFVCYGGPGQRCSENDDKLKCHQSLFCNRGRCQNCIKSDCHLELKRIPHINGLDNVFEHTQHKNEIYAS